MMMREKQKKETCYEFPALNPRINQKLQPSNLCFASAGYKPRVRSAFHVHLSLQTPSTPQYGDSTSVLFQNHGGTPTTTSMVLTLSGMQDWQLPMLFNICRAHNCNQLYSWKTSHNFPIPSLTFFFLPASISSSPIFSKTKSVGRTVKWFYWCYHST